MFARIAFARIASACVAVLPALLIAVSVTGAPAAAGGSGSPPVCAERAELVARLTGTFGERRQSYGLARGRGLVELYANPRSGTWTILLTRPDGTACLIAAGEAWEADGVPRGHGLHRPA